MRSYFTFEMPLWVVASLGAIRELDGVPVVLGADPGDICGLTTPSGPCVAIFSTRERADAFAQDCNVRSELGEPLVFAAMLPQDPPDAADLLETLGYATVAFDPSAREGMQEMQLNSMGEMLTALRSWKIRN
jgi:hypothetical protein